MFMDAAQTAQRSRRPAVLVLLTIASVVWIVSLAPAAAALLMSPMAFDSGESPEAWAMIWILLSYPVSVLVSLAGSWWAYARRRHRGALLFALLPLVPVAALFVLFAVGLRATQ
jgi:sterol desaturase/sphingolipid hydroxylase (fatty acid hydroxylase superfamily)